MNTKNIYSRVKSCVFLLCFTIVNRVSFFQVAIGKFNKKYNISSIVPSLFKHKKTSPQQEPDVSIGNNYKLKTKTIDETTYYKLISNTDKTNEINPCNYYFSSINLINNENNDNFDINIADNNFNYFCIDNIINKDFLLWYLQKFHKINLPEDYIISIIDHECEMFDLEKDKTIVLHEDTYKIV